MKRLTTLFLVFCTLFALTACFGEEDTRDLTISLGDTGATVDIPAKMGFEACESKMNDFYGISANEEWAIIANVEPKSDYPDCTLADYVSLYAEEYNGAVRQDLGDNYYFTYDYDMGEDGVYCYFTAVRENDSEFVRVAFYCLEETWDTYRDQFLNWSTTIEFE